jgi:hypothetical protein
MSKKKVFIVLTHKNMLKKGSQTEWEVQEIVECVDQLRSRHYSYSSAIGDYINRQMIKGARYNMSDYDKFEEYVEKKYPKEMQDLNTHWQQYRVAKDTPEDTEVFADEFGNIRPRTVFDTV